MLKRLLIILLWLLPTLALAQTLPAGIRLIESVETAPEPGQPFIAYQKYQLDNGLILLLHQDMSDPLVHVEVNYHVGSARERLGYSGFAHFFEHMMFQGSVHLGDKEYFGIINAAGGTVNGATNRDRTFYFQTVPANHLETVLWLESDRMGYMLPAVTEQRFEIQRDTVKNERAQRIDNQPYGRVEETLSEALYPREHPYSWPVIGYPADLDRSSLADLKQFLLRWYGPNNAVLVIAGQFDLQQTLDWVVQYFGPILPGPEAPPMDKALVSLAAERPVLLEDRIVQPLVQLAWPTVWWGHEDQPALSMLASLLGSGRGSVLQAELVETRKLLNAGARHNCGEIACSFRLYGLIEPGNEQTLADAEQLLREQLAALLANDALEQKLVRVKTRYRASTLFELQSAAGKARSLVWNQLFTGDPGYLAADLARYEAVTVDDLRRVWQRWLKDKPSVVQSVVPRGNTALAARKESWQPPPVEVASRADVLATRPTPQTFDRNRQPVAGPTPPLVTPAFWQSQLSNGIDVIGSYYDEVPTITFILKIPAGKRFEPVAQSGLANMTAAMLEEGTEQLDAVELARALEGLGSRISISTGNYFSTVVVSCLVEQFEPTLALLQQVLFQPRFAQSDFDRLKSQWLQALAQSKLRPGAVARRHWSWILYGRDNPLAWPNDGSEQTIAGISLDDVRRFYRQYYSPEGASLVMVGQIEQPAFEKAIEFLAKWQGEANPRSELPPLPKPQEAIYLVDMPGAVQSEVRLGRHGLPWDATGPYFRNTLMNYPLGGSFSSRLNQVIREQKGYTYGIGGYFVGSLELGSYSVTTSVRREVTGEALAEILAQLKAYKKDGPSDAEVDNLRQAISQQEALSYETPGQKASFLYQIHLFQLPADFPRQQAEIIARVTQSELTELARQWLPQRGTRMILVVGDKARVLPQLEALGLPIIELDDDGDPIEADSAQPATVEP